LAIEHRRGIFRQGARQAKGSQAGPLIDANQQANSMSVAGRDDDQSKKSRPKPGIKVTES
jgi:hypothetical protein